MEKQILFKQLTDKLMCRLKEKGYSESYIKFSYEIDLRKLKEHLEKNNSTMYTKELGIEFITITSMGIVGQNRKNSYKRTIRHLNEILDEDEFRPICTSSRSLQRFNYALALFEDDLKKKGLRERTISDRKHGVFYFLNYLETSDITEFEGTKLHLRSCCRGIGREDSSHDPPTDKRNACNDTTMIPEFLDFADDVFSQNIYEAGHSAALHCSPCILDVHSQMTYEDDYSQLTSYEDD